MIMNPPDYYWRTLSLPNFHDIQRKIQYFVIRSTTILKRGHYEGSNYRGEYSQQIIDNIPELALNFKLAWGLNVNAAALFVAWPDSGTHIPHTDHMVLGNKARINLPIFNCRDTYTAFYTNVQTNRRFQSNGEEYNAVINSDYIETTRVEILEPTLLRVSEPHAVLVDKARNYPRVTLTVKCDPDAVTLFN
jgi:hypothetical protein